MNKANLKIETKTVAYLCPEKIRAFIEEENYFNVSTSDMNEEFIKNVDKHICIGEKQRIATVEEIYAMAELIISHSFNRFITKPNKDVLVECIIECIMNYCIHYECESRIRKIESEA